MRLALMSKTNGLDVVVPAAPARVFSLPAAHAPAPAVMRQKWTLAVAAVGFSSHTATADPSARAITSGRPPTVARRVIGPSTAAAEAGAQSATRVSAARNLMPTRSHRVGFVFSDVRLELLAEQHLPAVEAMLSDPEIRRFTRVPEPPPTGFSRTWYERYEAGRADRSREAFAAVGADGGVL